ncbi:DUF3098 domain-containing protein [Flavobacterium sp.]|jgi:hypothetical protein|uniref:DUF3098 domain-containing protein n=1 Tax=Flavobacterium sp. TaxID=239 RepID=UPI0022C61825|nr:DUF3098 domain-containing protein [Flavobacterium sp.]MCZ8144749.1 DUF3098 domain-containing protein [Flavobacterium sp.]MCZ8367104.1 DUF3098 domain-containing protein [Flavobacterium sp.]
MSAPENKPDFLFKKENYTVLIIGLAVIALGFILMSGSSNDNPAEWNADIMSFRRIRLAPTVVLAGFGIVIYSIFRKGKSE